MMMWLIYCLCDHRRSSVGIGRSRARARRRGVGSAKCSLCSHQHLFSTSKTFFTVETLASRALPTPHIYVHNCFHMILFARDRVLRLLHCWEYHSCPRHCVVCAQKMAPPASHLQHLLRQNDFVIGSLAACCLYQLLPSRDNETPIDQPQPPCHSSGPNCNNLGLEELLVAILVYIIQDVCENAWFPKRNMTWHTFLVSELLC